jgi:hypothetical protein
MTKTIEAARLVTIITAPITTITTRRRRTRLQ